MPKQIVIRMLFFLGVVLITSSLAACKKETAAILKIGIPEEPNSLNIWMGTDANSRKILSQIYQPLFSRDPETLEIIPWLAKNDPVFNPEELSYTITLKSARWSDGSEFTSSDVLFTKQLFFDFKIPRYYSKWKAIKKLEVIDKHTVKFYLKKPSAIFLSRVLTAPLVSKKEWETITKKALTAAKPLKALQDHKIENPLGTGPFMIAEYKKGAYIHMKKNPYFFGIGKTIANHQLGPYVDDVLYKIYGTSDVAILALRKGDIDMFWWDIQPGYLKELKKDDHITVFLNKKSALYYMGFNLRKPPFNDKALRQAIATVIDKEFILTRILQNYGTPMHSIVPSGNVFWHNPDVRKYGHELTEQERFKEAVQILKDAGYSWEKMPDDATGNMEDAGELILPNGQPMDKFVILTPPADYDPKRAFAGIMIQEWLRKLGLPAFSRPMAFASLLDAVKGKHDFDAFILGYGRLNLDPDYLRAFFHSRNNKPRGWNMSGYKNPVFDQLAQAQKNIVNPDQRKTKILEMQRILLEDVPYIPLYNPHILEAVSKKRFSGWVEKVDGIGNIWSFCSVKPTGSYRKEQ